MPAVITERLKKDLLRDLYKDFQDSDTNYFAGVGRSEDWNETDTVPQGTPTNTLREDRNFRQGLQSVKNITDISFVVPRENWSSGATYSAYNDNQSGYPSNAYYIMNDNQQVYMCLQRGRRTDGEPVASTVQPTGNTTGEPFETADGYIWKFLYSIGALKASKFISSAYIPVQKVQDSANAPLLSDEIGIDSDSPAEDVEQQLVQQAAIGGQVLGYRVVSGGNGYTSTPTATVVGDGSGALADVTIVGQQVTKVTVGRDGGGNLAFGQGYSSANLELTGGGGSGAEIIPILSTAEGLGYDPRDDLRSSAIMFNTKPDGTENGDFVVDQDFRQIGLLKNLEQTDSNALFGEITGRALNKLGLTSITNGPFVVDQVIQGGTSNAKAFITDLDSASIWYHQTEYTGFGAFDSGETLSIVEGGGSTTATIDKILKGDVDPFSGELLYIDNRAPVIRSADQTEDLKIVIQL